MRLEERTTITIEEAARALGVARGTAYEAADDLGAIRVGERRLVVPVAPLAAKLGLTAAELLERLDEDSAA